MEASDVQIVGVYLSILKTKMVLHSDGFNSFLSLGNRITEKPNWFKGVRVR